MEKRTAIYLRQYHGSSCTGVEPADDFTSAVRNRGDILTDTYTDDGRIAGRGKYAAWRALLADLDDIDQIALADPGDLPGKTVTDFLGLLDTLSDRGVTLIVPSQQIDSGTGPAAVLALIRLYRAAKKSAAIKAGLNRAKAAGKHIGRPPIPESVRHRIVAELRGGTVSIRGTAKKFGVAPASVINIRQTMAPPGAEAT